MSKYISLIICLMRSRRSTLWSHLQLLMTSPPIHNCFLLFLILYFVLWLHVASLVSIFSSQSLLLFTLICHFPSRVFWFPKVLYFIHLFLVPCEFLLKLEFNIMFTNNLNRTISVGLCKLWYYYDGGGYLSGDSMNSF